MASIEQSPLELTEALEEARALLKQAHVGLPQRAVAFAVIEEINRALSSLAASASAVAGAAGTSLSLAAPPHPGSLLDQERESRIHAEASHRRIEFAYEATSTLFASPLDATARLQTLASLVVPDLADWCLCDMLGEGGTVRCIAARQWNPDKAEQARLLEEEYLLDPTAEGGISMVIRTGKSVCYFDRAGQPAGSSGVDEKRFERLLADVGAKSVMIVPLTTSGRTRTIGALTFLFAESSRRYQAADLALAEDLARRAALAADNAGLFEQLQRAVRARDDVVGMVSHDLRNPLSSIKLSVMLMQEDDGEAPEAADAQAKTAIILRAVDRMESLIRDLLDVTQIEAGGVTLTLESRRARDVLEEALDQVGPIAGNKRLSVSVTMADEELVIRCDPGRLMQVFSNLLGNAVKFTPAGGQITLLGERNGAFYTFAVSDSGVGIPEDQLAHVFDRFWQDRRKAREGTGLGLAIAKGIVEAHGGRISVKSVAGEGASFFFTIPLASGAAPEPSSERESGPSSERESGPSSGGVRIHHVSPVEGQEFDPPSRQRIIDSATSTEPCPPRRQPIRRENTALYLNDAAIVDQTPFLRQTLRRRGVRPADLDDMVQETVLGAWRSMKAGRYRPAPNLTPGDALRVWLAGVALRQASHYRNSATRRCEIPAVDPQAVEARVWQSAGRVLAWEGRVLHGARRVFPSEEGALHGARRAPLWEEGLVTRKSPARP